MGQAAGLTGTDSRCQGGRSVTIGCFMVRRSFLALVACAAALPADGSEEKLVGGPFVVHAGPRAATVVWVTQAGEARLGTDPKELREASPSLRVHKAGFTNLKPGQKYYYDVLGRDEGKGSFKTAPTGPASFQFVVYGDTRTRHALHQRIVDAVVKVEPDFVLHTGDLVADGTNTSQWPVFFQIERELLRKTVFFPALGNHERNSRHFYEFFDITTPYYSFDWGSAHFTILNSDLGNAAESEQAKERFWAEQLRWLEEDLTAHRKADFRFVAMHHPPFTAVKRRQGPNPHLTAMVPLFEQYRVAAVFLGHDHNYQHHLKNGVRYIVTGGGGAPLYPVDAPIEGITQKVESTEHYVRVCIEGDRAVMEAVALDGHLIDRIELGPAPPNIKQ